MIMNLIVLVFVLSIIYAWMVRGVFNSMIHLLCVIAAGAIAFGFWEKLAVLLISMSPERGFFSFLESIAWGVALIVPFAVSVVVLRLITDKLIPKGIQNSTIVNYAGGAVGGIGTAVISAGILVIGIGSMRVSTNFLGYQPLWYSADRATGAGSLVKEQSLWIPVDQLTAKFYSMLSTGSMSTDTPLSKWYPELHLAGFSTRVSPGEGQGRNAINPDDFKIKSTYIVGDPKGTSKVNELLKDKSSSQSQRYLDINSEPVTTGYLAGYVIDFEPGAKERGKKGGQLVVSNGQYRLLIENDKGETQTVFPVAAISESSQPNKFGRWRFDANDVFITSVGGKSRVSMAFEYVIPQGYHPIALYVKNIRVDATKLTDPIEYTTTNQRDRLVLTGSILKGESSDRVLKKKDMVIYDPSANGALIRTNMRIQNMMSSQIAKRGMTLDAENDIVDGEGTWNVKNEVGRKNTPNDKNLRVDRYAQGAGQTIVKVNISADTEFGLFSDACRDAATDEPFLLIDENGNEYEAIGFEYEDSKTFHARYTLGATLSGIQDTPTLSRSRSDQELTLLFVVTSGVKIEYYTIGDLAIAHFVPPLDTKQ
ncbi:MAG: CvpA family protein [Phycisphaerales bacterium]